jgi:hypothetical protein
MLINGHVSDEYVFEYRLLVWTSILDHMNQLLSPASRWIVNCCSRVSVCNAQLDDLLSGPFHSS